MSSLLRRPSARRAQALLANIAAMYAVYHGPEGLTAIATRVRALTHALAAKLGSAGYSIVSGPVFFDTITVDVAGKVREGVDVERGGCGGGATDEELAVPPLRKPSQ
jgi:glycine cleavage system pyridoxal-binding protein P